MCFVYLSKLIAIASPYPKPDTPCGKRRPTHYQPFPAILPTYVALANRPESFGERMWETRLGKSCRADRYPQTSKTVDFYAPTFYRPIKESRSSLLKGPMAG